VKKAFEGDMHVKTPKMLKREIYRILKGFGQEPPKYIVDSRKQHFPWNRPPLELWPTTQRGLLPNQKEIVEQFDKSYEKMLAERIDPDEAARYQAMAPFRKFVMDNYVPAEPKHYVQSGGQYVHRMFGAHRVYELKKSKAPK
jgi:hypothetical protein